MNENSVKYKAGLDRKEAERALEEFLKSGNNVKVFALKGGWGIGKTHLVKTFLAGAKQSYRYGSIFGVSTIEELKMQLWSNFNSDTKVDEKRKRLDFRNLFTRTTKNSKDLGNVVEAIPSMGEYGIGFTPAVISLVSNLIVNRALQDQLICIDDLERRSANLSLNEVLGFIENLMEDKNCKVIIIYNEEKLKKDEESNRVLTEYREKIIDFEVNLDPSLIGNFRIGFGENDPDEDIIFNYFVRARIRVNNIRILKRIKLHLDKVRPAINSFLPEVRFKIINEVIFMTLAKLDTNFPVDFDKLMLLGSSQNTLNTSEDKDIYLHACQIGYTNSVISNEIFRLIETSVCNDKVIQDEGEKLNSIEKSHKIEEKLREAYKPYSESFESSEEDLRKNLTDFLEKYCEFLDFRKIQGLTDISRAINLVVDPYWKKWFQHQIIQAKTLENLYYLQSIIQANQFLEASELLTELDNKIAVFEKDMSIDAILIRLLDREGWSQKDADYLNSRTSDQWKQWLLVKHPDKVFMIRQALEMSGESSKTLRSTIAELAQDSALNKMRAKKLYDVILEDVGT
ncbi:MAG TPA: P-loop NTPase fold protein [Coleofasciculaceae cyanobacterium]|jgi:hypothetical protein